MTTPEQGTKPAGRKKQAAATIAVGTGLVGGGAELRHAGIKAAEATGRHKRIAALALTHRGAKGRARWLAGTAMGTVGGAGMGFGAHELVYPPKQVKAAADDSRPRVDLQRHATDFVRQGIAGNADAFNQKIENARAPVPHKVRLQQVAASTAAGGAGSLAAHRVMDRRMALRGGKQVHGRHAVAAIAGTSAIIGSLPLTSRLAHRQGYEFTPTGVRRRKTPPVRPTRSRVVETRPDRSGRSYSSGPLVKRDIEKAEKKVHLAVGRSGRPACGTGPRPTTDTVTATRHTSKVNCAACKRTHQARSLAAVGKAIEDESPWRGGAGEHRTQPLGTWDKEKNRPKQRPDFPGHHADEYTTWSDRYADARSAAKRAAISARRRGVRGSRPPGSFTDIQEGMYARGRDGTPPTPKPGTRAKWADPENVHRLRQQAKEYDAARETWTAGMRGERLAHMKAQKASAQAAQAAGKAKTLRRVKIGGAVLGTTAAAAVTAQVLTRRKKIEKAVLDTGLTQAEQRDQLKRKRRNLGIGITSSAIGASGVGILAAKEIGPHLPRIGARMKAAGPKLERAGLTTALLGGGVGSISGLQSAGIQHKDLKAQGRALGVVPKSEKSAALVSNARLFTGAAVDGQFGGPPPGAQRTPTVRASNIAARKTRNGVTVPVRRANTVSKIETTMDDKQAKKLVAQHGAKGPLPKGLDRPTRMKAYEARYIAAGGPKGERWKRRADTSDHVTGGMLAIGGSAGLTELATKTPRVKTALARRGHNAERIATRSGRVGVAAGTAAAGSELFHRHASHRQASYASSPAGVAASALHRMRDYTP